MKCRNHSSAQQRDACPLISRRGRGEASVCGHGGRRSLSSLFWAQYAAAETPLPFTEIRLQHDGEMLPLISRLDGGWPLSGGAAAKGLTLRRGRRPRSFFPWSGPVRFLKVSMEFVFPHKDMAYELNAFYKGLESWNFHPSSLFLILLIDIMCHITQLFLLIDK